MKRDRQYIYFDKNGNPEIVESRDLMSHVWKQVRKTLEDSYIDVADINTEDAPTFKQIHENRFSIKRLKFKVFGSFSKLQVMVEKD